jgi:tRNA-2-methylthio-N6-dimethylallyladenosine synthase
MIPFFIETYGCQMNVSDSEVVARLLSDNGYRQCERFEEARIIFVNTCSIRDNAEKRVMGRLDLFARMKKKDPGLKVGVLGCMATRLKEELLAHPAVDLVVGPDSYRQLPRMLGSAVMAPMEVKLSLTETYADIKPFRGVSHGISSFVTIMRGCNNMCAYCIVPYVRGRERSRDPFSIEEEVRDLFAGGFREVTLLGQNVNSYCWKPDSNTNQGGFASDQADRPDSRTPEDGQAPVTFAQLLERVAAISPLLRVRYTTSHPKDMQDDVLYAMAAHPNICKHIHLPVQSGSNSMLKKMNRGYTREEYLDRIAAIHRILPGCTISSDMISGFCSETEEDHAQTLSLMEEVRFDQAFMFHYSQRPNTLAARHYPDDVPENVKIRRLNEIIALQNRLSLESNRVDVGKVYEVLVEGVSKRSGESFFGRTGSNKVCVFPKEDSRVGDYVRVLVLSCTAATLKGEIVKET